jgi:hypothetical protein
VNDGYKIRSRDLCSDIMLNYYLFEKLNLIRCHSFNLLVYILTGGYHGVLPTHDGWSVESDRLSYEVETCQFPCCKDLLVMILLLWDLKVARKNKNISNVYSDILFHVRIMVNSFCGFKPFLLMDGWLVLRILLMMFYYYLYEQGKWYFASKFGAKLRR